MRREIAALRGLFLQLATVEDLETGFIDFDPFKGDPQITAQVAQVLAQEYRHRNLGADVVLGVARSGINLAKATACVLELPFAGSQKDRILTGERAKDYFSAQVSHSFTHQGRRATIFLPMSIRERRVLVVDDVVAYGHTATGVIKALNEQRCTVVAWAAEMAKLFQGGVERIQNLGITVITVIEVKAVNSQSRIILA